MKQPREGQAYYLPKSAADERTTHVAINRQHGFKYFCRQENEKSYQATVEPGGYFESPYRYYITPCALYGSCYNGCSLWQGGFDFVPLEDWQEEEEEKKEKKGYFGWSLIDGEQGIVVLKDVLHNLSAGENGGNHEYGKGVLVGVISTLISCGMSFEDSCKLVWQCLPADCHPFRFPEEWVYLFRGKTNGNA